MTPYTDRIKRIAPGHDPRHVEAYMRVAHGTLDRLPANAFRRDVEIAVTCIKDGGIEMAERVAKSYGL